MQYNIIGKTAFFHNQLVELYEPHDLFLFFQDWSNLSCYHDTTEGGQEFEKLVLTVIKQSD